ncbi:hypothetical protein P9112_005630 [Eukaryota sp. TZLM1-RC]
MVTSTVLPSLLISLSKVHSNATNILSTCRKHKVQPCAVTKGVCADPKVAETLINAGFDMLADSRIQNLIELRRTFPSIKLLHLRIPMISEINQVVETVDYSLVSEWETLVALNASAKMFHKVHNVILMLELGDLREGMHEEELFSMIPYFANSTTVSSELVDHSQSSGITGSFPNVVKKLENISLTGIGVNLTCYGGVLPDETNLGKLADIANKVSKYCDLEIISGGNSSSFYLLEAGSLPPFINNLRLGESLLLGRECAFGKLINGCVSDAFTIEAEIVELRTKPSIPTGTIGMNAFGETPSPPKDNGMVKRAILALGEQDADCENLVPLDEGVEILGASSDHLIVDVTNSGKSMVVGDTLTFGINYSTLLKAFTSKYVGRKYV